MHFLWDMLFVPPAWWRSDGDQPTSCPRELPREFVAGHLGFFNEETLGHLRSAVPLRPPFHGIPPQRIPSRACHRANHGRFPLGECRERASAGIHEHHSAWSLARRHCGVGPYVRLRAIKSSIADSLHVVMQIERRPGRRYISEVLGINGYDPDADLFDYGAIYERQDPHP